MQSSPRASRLLVLAVPYFKIESTAFVGLDDSFELGNVDGGLRKRIALVANDKVEKWLDRCVGRGGQWGDSQDVQSLAGRGLSSRLTLAHDDVDGKTMTGRVTRDRHNHVQQIFADGASLSTKRLAACGKCSLYLTF